MTTRKGILIDVKKCIGCRACSIACKAENRIPEGAFATTIKENWDGKFPDVNIFFTKVSCMHCSEPTCVEVCPTGALYVTDTGVVAHDLDKCIGCQYCVNNCPFGIPTYDSKSDKSYKCDMCIGRTSNGMLPACVATCPTGALEFGDLEVLKVKAADRLAALIKDYPNANIYQPTAVGGTGVIYVLTDKPAKFGLDPSPVIPASVSVWKDWVQPYAGWLIPVALAGSAVSFVTTRLLAIKNEGHDKGGHN